MSNLTRNRSRTDSRATESKKSPLSAKRSRLIYGVTGVGTVFAIWFAITGLGVVNTFLMPTPQRVVTAAIELIRSGELGKDTLASLLRVLAGFAIALIAAVPVGIAMGLSFRIRNLLDPLVELIRPIPPIAVIPLALLWFGIGEESKVFLIAYGAFFPILLNTFTGMMAIDQNHMRAILTLGATRRQAIRHVVLPSAFPNIVVGARLGIAMGFIVLVAAELLAADSGLGFLIQDARQRFATDIVFVGIIVIGILGLALNQIMLVVERLAVPWRFVGNRT